ncbi:MAG: cysteine desulfurase-like protein [Gemmatimonadaceae bacterium]
MATPVEVFSGMKTVEEIRSRFPALKRQHGGHPVAYFDGPGGTQVPSEVVRAMSDYLLHHNANTHWNYPTSAETDVLIAEARTAMADFFNSRSDEVAFGNNMTTLTFHIARSLGRQWGAGDEVIVTELDHHANIAPWRDLARERGVTVRTVPFNPATGLLDWEELERTINPRTRLLAIGAASNALGTINNVREAARLAHAVGALCFVDSVHFASHGVTDVRAIGCDLLVCSPYKFYGPHAGVAYVRSDLLLSLAVPKLDPAPNEIPDRLETGTQNHEGIVGTGAAVDFLASLSTAGGSRRERLVRVLTALHERGDELVQQLWSGLAANSRVQLYGPPPGSSPRTPTVSFVVDGISSSDVATRLAARGMFVSHGDFYASTIVERLGHAADGVVRAGCACYTTAEEVDRLVSAISEIAAG